MRRRLRGEVGEFLDVDADREHGGAGPAMRRDDDAVMHGKIELACDIAEEILAILLGLEADQVVGQHRLDQFAMMRHARHQRARRPRRVQEEADRLRNAEFAQLGAEREEMIILHPEGGIVLAEAQQRARHEGVDFAIAEIVFAGGADQVGARMQRRPQRRIGEAFVIAAIMRRRQIEQRQRAGARATRFRPKVRPVAVADLTGRADPDRAGFFHHRQQRRRKPTRHGLIGLAARDAV